MWLTVRNSHETEVRKTPLLPQSIKIEMFLYVIEILLYSRRVWESTWGWLDILIWSGIIQFSGLFAIDWGVDNGMFLM